MKQLIIIVYKINVDGLSRSRVDEQIDILNHSYSLTKDEELKNDYIIREIWLPITESPSDVKVIYPVTLDNEQLEDLINDLKVGLINDRSFKDIQL
jgi:hypothetical protein